MIFTARQMMLIAEAGSLLASIAHAAHSGDEGALQEKLTDLSESWIVMDAKSQEWGTIYDLTHRYKPPVEPTAAPTPDPSSISPRLLALEFTKELRRTLDGVTMDEVVRRNAQYREQGTPELCASHEFCDSNVCMIAALEKLGLQVEANDENGNTLINAAWGIAKAAEFQIYKLR